MPLRHTLILKNREAGGLFIHYNGAYHSNRREGIAWYVGRQSPKPRVLTISTATQPYPATLDEGNRGLADFIIVVPETMARTC